ncbi:MAG: outer membrane lipoprotein carrier protein LolA [Proteobacteria bacterium]|nr:outer membrane lipoprotein carrier protein LolA [Pseudomonadota bacterium]
MVFRSVRKRARSRREALRILPDGHRSAGFRDLGRLVLAALALPLVGYATPAPQGSLEELMRGMATTSGVVAHFTESKSVSLLDAPLESSGILYFIPPDRLVRRTSSPGKTSVTIDRGRFRFEDETGGESADLSANPIAREFVDNFIVLFNGNLEALRARYALEFRTDSAGWELELTPRHAPLTKFVARIVLRGAEHALREMEMTETDGDRTATRFRDVEVDHHFSDEELAALFPDPSPPAADAVR